MQRPSGNNVRQASGGGGSGGGGSGGRRAYNRAHNNSFKFHNFVFNQDNQSFCLEEQHGNKKITVLHWKKSEGLPAKECDSSSSNKSLSLVTSSSLPSTSDDDVSNAKDDQVIEAAFPPTCSTSASHVAVRPAHSVSDYLPTALEHASSSGVFSDRSLASSGSVLTHHHHHHHPQSHLDLLSKSTNTSSSAYGTNFSSFASYYSNYSSSDSPELAGCSFQRPRPSSLQAKSNEEEEDDENEDDEMDSDTDDFKNYLGYRNQLKLYTKLIEQQQQQQQHQQQSQPLDLSLKSRDIIDYNNNNNNNNSKGRLVAQDSKEDDETLSEICESENSYSYNNDNTLLSSKCFRFAPNISVSASELELHRRKPIVQSTPTTVTTNTTATSNSSNILSERCDESISPSLLISSVKCCSPAPADATRVPPPPLTLNPFNFPMTSAQLHQASSSIKQPPYSSSSSLTSSSAFLSHHHHQHLPQAAPPTTVPFPPPTHASQRYPTTRPFTFDTFLEDEIYKILLQSSTPPPPLPVNSMSTAAASSSSSATSPPTTTSAEEATTTTTTAAAATRLTSKQQLQHEGKGSAAGRKGKQARGGTHTREGATEEVEETSLDTQKRLEEKIEEKLRRLQHEIQQQQQQRSNDFFDFSAAHRLGDVPGARTTSLFDVGSGSSGGGGGGGLEPCQDHLRLHFKFDANKNLELHRASESVGLANHRLQHQQQQQQQQHAPSQSTRTSTPPLPPPTVINQMSSSTRSTRAAGTGSGAGGAGTANHRNQIKRQLEETFKQNGFLVKTKQVSDANNSAMFCKFRQLRKYTRYYLKSWQSHLPEEVGKLWKGFLPPKTEHRHMFQLTAGVGGDGGGRGGGVGGTIDDDEDDDDDDDDDEDDEDEDDDDDDDDVDVDRFLRPEPDVDVVGGGGGEDEDVSMSSRPDSPR